MVLFAVYYKQEACDSVRGTTMDTLLTSVLIGFVVALAISVLRPARGRRSSMCRWSRNRLMVEPVSGH